MLIQQPAEGAKLAHVLQPEAAGASSGVTQTAKLSVVSPTFNEAENVDRLQQALRTALGTADYEVLIVDDDSPDRTWERAEQLARSDMRLRVIRRQGKRALGLAVMEGFDHARGEIVACIDADLQHDPRILPEMVKALRDGADLVVGCRYTEGGGTSNWNAPRRAVSRMATGMAHIFLGVGLKDPMSGFFMLRRADYLKIRDRLDGDGFKILLEIAAAMSEPRVAEVAYTFGRRLSGQSKLSSRVVFAYLKQLYRLSRVGRLVPAEFVKFGIVGAIGLIVNLLAMASIFRWGHLTDWRASLGASGLATISNYILNNSWTFRHRIRKGMTFFSGYFMYLAFATVGLAVTTVAYVGFSKAVALFVLPGYHYHALPEWILILCQLLAVLAGTYFNYRLNKKITWGTRAHRPAPEPAAKARGTTA